MNKLIAGLVFVAFSQLHPLAAQSGLEGNLSPRVRVYIPKYLKRDRAEQVARFVRSVLANDVLITWEPVINGLVLEHRGPAKFDNSSGDLDKTEALLKRLDVPEPAPTPERQIEMTVHLIRAYTDPGHAKGSAPVPPELADVVKEMKGALPYAGFGLVDTIQVKVRDGLQLEDALPNAITENIVQAPFFYNLMFNGPSTSADGKIVSIRSFRFGIKVPVGMTAQYQDESITTPLTIYDAQKQVLGKLKMRPSSGDDLFVVLSCKVK